MASAATKRLVIAPTTIAKANAFVTAYHRHNKRVQGARFAISALLDGEIVGVAIVGRPVAWKLDDGLTAEVTRCCTDGIKRTLDNGHTVPVCSKLYAACWRAWQAMGGRKLITYTLQSEPGSSLSAVGFQIAAEVKTFPAGKGWTSREGREYQDVNGQAKFRWEAVQP
ncbi:hypothetical protein IVB18_26275 [Bradyrhizobium sp. 186]|uniref:XF1762 family protein n=1 Tax=Bradyrhizobium sp. 186 TaxID=2782654 RepID=UPI002000E97B|nr:XF1762 family protein [Bradyrhizobium sp. 186]UPK31838.1 hypothetical protein IVB18_26275 [Bradyrhizobium sp. 186]